MWRRAHCDTLNRFYSGYSEFFCPRRPSAPATCPAWALTGCGGVPGRSIQFWVCRIQFWVLSSSDARLHRHKSNRFSFTFGRDSCRVYDMWFYHLSERASITDRSIRDVCPPIAKWSREQLYQSIQPTKKEKRKYDFALQFSRGSLEA